MDVVCKELYQVILDRKEHPQEGSYTGYLFREGLDKILKKVGEECAETIIAAKNGDPAGLVCEISDLLYHVLVMMVQTGIPLAEVTAELERRTQKIGNLKALRTVDRQT